MPYRNAPYYVAVVIAVILLGFGPSYWSVLPTSRWQFHLHGAISSLWVLMVLPGRSGSPAGSSPRKYW